MGIVEWIFIIIAMIGAAGFVTFILALFTLLVIAAYKGLVQ